MLMDAESIFIKRPLVVKEEGELAIAVDSEASRWIGTDRIGMEILEQFDGRRSLADIVRDYAVSSKLDWTEAWQDVSTIAADGLRHKILGRTDSPLRPRTYNGRESFFPTASLKELWLHTNNSCNLSCSHCLVSSGPQGEPGLTKDRWLSIIDDGYRLGVRRFFFTGGEPFIRRDAFELVDAVLKYEDAELAVLTNGIPFRGGLIEELKRRDLNRLRLQISIDGSTAEINDPIRGKGSFEKTVDGIRAVVAAGADVTITSVITTLNIADISRVTRLAADLGARAHHLLWMHKRGRSGSDDTPRIDDVIAVVRDASAVAKAAGIVLDNCEAIKARLMAASGTKRDLSGACVNSLCIYADGKVYPSAAFADISELCCGDVLTRGLEEILKTSEVVKNFRAQTVARREPCRNCDIRFFCGGGDIEHSWYHGGSLEALDPYCELHKAMFADGMAEITADRKRLCMNGRSGYKSPVVYVGMGEGSVHCATAEEYPCDQDGNPVMTTHSECVVSFDIDAPRKLVREFYGNAAETPQEDLCCPVKPDADDLRHIPAEVVERFYGCGSPVADAGIRQGEVTLDLGSGAGIDVFIAARRTGPDGRAIGVDMTDAMLNRALHYKEAVARNLGYDNTEFRKGFLESIPADDSSVDVVTSNCVINLSPDKLRVIADIWRILKDHGRMVISDIVAESEVPSYHRKDPRLWGECISGALTLDELVAYMERAGFYGVRVMRRSFWKEVDGFRFHSVTVSGYKFEKKEGCRFVGQSATYLGPFKGIADEQGHWFPRNVPVRICTDTAAKLGRAPYQGLFVITDESGLEQVSCCSPSDGPTCC